MAPSRWPVTCQPAYPPALLHIFLPPSFLLSTAVDHTLTKLSSPPTFFLSQIAACLPLYPFTIACIVLRLPVCVSACLSVCRAVPKAVIHWAWPWPGGFAPRDQWEGFIEYTRYELHVSLSQRRQKKGSERRVLHTPCLWPLPHPDTVQAGLSRQVYTLNHDITCAELRGIHRVI